jgi:hypothetical protein
MQLLSWLSDWMTARNKKRRTPARRFRPRLEVLEGRDVPSTWTVTSAADSGPGSLRAEIGAASAGDTIVFAAGVGEITLTSGELDITKSLTIQGPGASQLAISGGNASRVIEVDGATTNVTLSGLTITQGNDQVSNGGGIFNNGSTLTLSGCAVTSCTASLGGGIYNEAGKMTIGDCTVSLNTTQGWAGGIYNYYGTMSITNSTISGNSALAPDGGATANVGGGLYNQMGSVTMSNCTLSNNSAGYEGGDVYNYDAPITVVSGTKKHSTVTTTGTLTMTGCTVTGNTVDFGYGAGFYNASSSAATLTISDTAFSDNGLISGTHYYYGGAFSNDGPWTDGGGNTFTYP